MNGPIVKHQNMMPMRLNELIGRTPEGEKGNTPKEPLTNEQRQRRKKMLIYPLMGLMFLGSMWLIFSPSAEDKEQEQSGTGFNTEMPLPTDAVIIGDKEKAYEQASLEARQKDRDRAVQDLASLFDNAGTENEGADSYEYDLLNPGGGMASAGYAGGGSTGSAAIRNSADAYRDINATLGNFYETPEEDTEKEDLQKRVDELEAMMAQQQAQPSSMDEQIALLEKSYELAAKYMPGGQNVGGQTAVSDQEDGRKAAVHNGNAVAMPVGTVTSQIVSSLPQPMSDAEFVAGYTQERNYGFNTAVGTARTGNRNTISACVHSDQTITDGQSVRLRLLEAMRVSDMVIPRNTVIVGAARVQGERLGIMVSSIEYGGTIIPVELSVFDSDGQEGIFIPGSMEIDAVREIAANMGGSLGSSISISTNAGAQLASDLGRSVIQGTSQYIAQKMRTVKVHLKAGYKVLLYQYEN